MSENILNRDTQKFLRVVENRMKHLLGEQDLTSLPMAKSREVFVHLLAPEQQLPTIAVDVTNTSFTYDSVKIPLRIYKPTDKNQDLPALIFFHGGGFVFGNLDLIDYSCRLLTQKSQCMIISVDYRKAPEHKFPIAHEDCYQAVKYVQMNAKEFGCNGILAVGGESAGGNLAASICHMAKKTKEVEISAQILYYPWVNLNNDSASNAKFATGYVLETPALNWMRDLYLSKPQEVNDPLVSPLLQKDFSNLPPALIIAGECDPIRDESKKYFDRLIAANVDAQFVEFAGVTHGFFAMPWFFESGFFSFSIVSDYLNRKFC